MQKNREVFLKYTSKRAGVANGWKKWQGELRGLKLNDALGKKQDYERNFQQWAITDNSLPYADDLLSQMAAKSLSINDILKTDEYFKEAVYGVELIQQASLLDKMLQVMRSGLNGGALKDSMAKLSKASGGFYKNYDAQTDKHVFDVLMPLFMNKCVGRIPAAFTKQYNEQGKNYTQWGNYVFSSIATSSEDIAQFADNSAAADSNKIKNDPAWILYNAANQYRSVYLTPYITRYYNDMAYLNRLYMNAQMQLDKHKVFYPDANLTLRLTYGKIDGIDPDGPAEYSYQTTLDGVIAKDNPDVDEFKVPQKLKELYNKKDYGRWAVNGTVPVAFIASNHTSGGNSGSPVLNAKGELIGTNFDRVWEGTMSDLYFDPNLCRNISLDIRYTLFIVEKFGNAGWLLKEMKIVNEKKK